MVPAEMFRFGLLLASIRTAAGAPAAEQQQQSSQSSQSSPSLCNSQTICVDGINECGVRWGGCFDRCQPSLRPTAPACTPTIPIPTGTWVGTTSTAESTTTGPPPTLITSITTATGAPSTASTSCEPKFLCIDGINECGQGWGGCYDTCKPWLEPTAPSCSLTPPKVTTSPASSLTGDSSTRTEPITSIDTPTPTTGTPGQCTPQTLCIEGVNECGEKWGGCYDVCTPSLKPSPPSCSVTVPPPTPSTTAPPVLTTPVAPTSDNCSTRTVCWDGIDACGQMYGGCFPDCKPWPTFAKPPCPPTSTHEPWVITATEPPTTSSTVSARDGCSSKTLCWTGANECGTAYGGCFPDCTPWPTFSKPPCPTGFTTRKIV